MFENSFAVEFILHAGVLMGQKSAHRGGNYRLRARLALVDHGNSVVHSSPWMHSMMKSVSTLNVNQSMKLVNANLRK